MKKLIAIAALVASVASAQAGTVAWNILSVTKDDTLLTSGLNYMFFATSAEAAQSQIADIIATAGKGKDAVTAALSASPWHDTKKATAAGEFTIGVTPASGSYTLPENGDLGLADSTRYYAYAVIFDTETITDDSNFIVAQGTATEYGLKTKSATTTQTATYDLGGQAGATWYAVSDVPEPTSGLLLLLGVAGLALRRRRA